MQPPKIANLSNAKGNELESAVRRIETAILSSNPSLKEKAFAIESKKWIEVGGVRHEIDIFVEVDVGHEYKANFIFECKNWAKSVGKNEIIVFSEKIKAASAQRGFFVAQSFSRHAVAQAAADARIQLLTADQVDAPVPFRFHFVSIDNIHAHVDLCEGYGTAIERTWEALDIRTAEAFLDGERLDLKAYVDKWLIEERDNHTRSLQTDKLESGLYPQDVVAERAFEAGRLKVNGMVIGRVKISLRFDLSVAWPRVISNLEVRSRGRSIAFEPVGGIEVGFVQIRTQAG